MPSGRRMKALISATRIHYAGREAMLAATVDITELRETEAALRGEPEPLPRLHGLRAARRAPARRRGPLPDVQPAHGGADRRAGSGGAGKDALRKSVAGDVGNATSTTGSVAETGKLHASEQYLTYNPDDPRWTMAIRFPGPRRQRRGRGGRHLRGRHHRAQGGRGGAAGVRGAAERDQRRQPGADEHRPASPTASSFSSTSPISGSSGWRTSIWRASTAPRSTRTRPSATGTTRSWRRDARSPTTRPRSGASTGRRCRCR